jgi:hypothetical protein
MQTNSSIEPPDLGLAAAVRSAVEPRPIGVGDVVPAASTPKGREGSSEPSPLFTRHTRGAIEAERDRRRQRRRGGGAAYRGKGRGRAASHVRIPAAVVGNARAVAQARLDLDRWVDEGGLVPFEAAALLRATSN